MQAQQPRLTCVHTTFEFSANDSLAMSTAYKPSATRTSDDTIATFITAELEESLTQVPGVGPKNEEILRANDITTTYQLLGKFLTFKGEVRVAFCNSWPAFHVDHAVIFAQGANVTAVCDSFYSWLKEIGVNSSRASIIKACAEKVTLRARRSSSLLDLCIVLQLNTWVPGFYDESAWTD